MKRFFSAIAKLLIFVLLFYYVVNEGILESVVRPAVDWLVEWTQEDSDSTTSSVAVEDTAGGNSGTFVTVNPFDPPGEVDAAFLQDRILQLTNDLRVEHGAEQLSQNDTLEQAANIRAQETAESFSHTRPDGTEFYTVLEETDAEYFYSLAGENLAMGTHHLDDAGMAEFLFQGWVESEGHFQNMIEPDFEEMGVGVYFDGEILYLVQIFGTQF